MDRKPASRPLFKLPRQADHVLFLIGEELKSRKFFGVLRQVDMDYSYFEPHLDSLIFAYLGLNGECDKTFDHYHRVMEKRCRKIEANAASVNRQALKVYQELTTNS